MSKLLLDSAATFVGRRDVLAEHARAWPRTTAVATSDRFVSHNGRPRYCASACPCAWKWKAAMAPPSAMVGVPFGAARDIPTAPTMPPRPTSPRSWKTLRASTPPFCHAAEIRLPCWTARASAQAGVDDWPWPGFKRIHRQPPAVALNVSVPPTTSASCCAMARPSPVPPVSRLRLSGDRRVAARRPVRVRECRGPRSVQIDTAVSPCRHVHFSPRRLQHVVDQVAQSRRSMRARHQRPGVVPLNDGLAVS